MLSNGYSEYAEIPRLTAHGELQGPSEKKVLDFNTVAQWMNIRSQFVIGVIVVRAVWSDVTRLVTL